jgi:hypothetical protein
VGCGSGSADDHKRLTGLNISPAAPYISGMPSKRVPSPKETIKVRRSDKPATKLPPVGSKIPIEATVTRHGRNGYDTADTITIRIPGYDIPVTVTAKYVLGGEDA